MKSDETKQKTSKTLKEKYKNGTFIPASLVKCYEKDSSKEQKNKKTNSDIYNFLKLSELINKGLVLNPNNMSYDDCYVSPSKYKERTCIVCGINFQPSLTKSGNISVANTCSNECHKKLVIENSKTSAEKIISEGRHQGWKTRNVSSYPEKFWMKVLDSNFIPYIREKHVFGRYFLDFFIEKNGVKIDLEIDGKQHLYEDRREHDKQRDNFLINKGYVVYRIPWNEINSENGKLLMKSKINEFLDFFNGI